MLTVSAVSAKWVAGIFRYTTAFLLFALMGLTCVDVVGRYFLNKPLYGGLEITEVVLAGMIFTALPMVSYGEGHIVVELVDLPSRILRFVVHMAANLTGAVASAVLAHQLWFRAARLGRAGETTIQIQIPLDFVAYFMSALLALNAVAFVLRAFQPAGNAQFKAEL